jgi:transformation/transcription domain-associated protein
VKTLSLIAYFRDFSELIHSYEEDIAKNVHSLIHCCPAESVSTRKELLVDFRLILATDFRKGFVPYLDSLLDENFLMGPGRQAYETLRPLTFLTIGDVVQQTRDTLNFSQISRVIYLFSKNLHDNELAASIQTTSVKILVSIAEKFATTHYDQVGMFSSIYFLNFSRFLCTRGIASS